MNGYNPMLEYQRNQLMAQQAMIQNQLNQMNQQYPAQQYQQQYQQNPLQTQYFAKEVNNFDETKRIIPNPNEIYILLDSSGQKIYLKQMNSENGRAEYLTYNIDRTANDTPKDPMEQINARLTAIENKIGGLYESVSSNEPVQTNNEQSGWNDQKSNDREAEKHESTDVRPGYANDKRKDGRPAA